MARRSRRITRPAVVLRWLGVAVVCAIAVAYVQPIRAYRDAGHEVKTLKAQRAELARRHAKLVRKLERSGADAFVEREARRLGLVRPGERLYVVKGVQSAGGDRSG